MSAAEKTETKYELIPVSPCSDVYEVDAEIRIDGKIVGHAYKVPGDREMPWCVSLFPDDKTGIGGAGIGKTYFEAIMDAFGSCVRITEDIARRLDEFTRKHEAGLTSIGISDE